MKCWYLLLSYHNLKWLNSTSKIIAKPCSSWSLIGDENVEKECRIQGTSTVCTAKCARKFTFVSEKNAAQQFTCTNGIWSPSNVIPACVPVALEPARYELTVSIDYAIFTPVGSECLKVIK